MGFADAYGAYLQKHAIRPPLFLKEPDPQLNTIITIPAYNESGLLTCLTSLFNCDPPLAPTEVLVLINSAKSSSAEIVEKNRQVYKEVMEWILKHRLEIHYSANSNRQEIKNHYRPTSHQQHKPRFFVTLMEDLPEKQFGAGLARKLVMDEAVRRFMRAEELGNPKDGIIVSLDADAVVRQDYLRALEEHFKKHPLASGCSISFEHPLNQHEYYDLFSKAVDPSPTSLKKTDLPPVNYPPEVFKAVTNYELHQRYYLLAVRHTGYPYAFHTVGSCFAVHAETYCRVGGMNRRKAGEDFYFIQKVAMQGRFTECRSTRVYPSPRPSDRVPFGTGPDISRQISTSLPPYLTYHPELFEHLRRFFASIPGLYRSDSNSASADVIPDNDAAVSTYGIPRILSRYLEESGFWEEMEEIRANTASEAAFRKRFYGKFNMFRILKYLHFAMDQGVEKMEVTEAAGMMLRLQNSADVRSAEEGKGPDFATGCESGIVREPGREGQFTGKADATREMLLLYRKQFG